MAKQKIARRKPVTVTYQKGKGFKKMIGWCTGKSGARQPRIWWLGHNEKQAKTLASFIDTYYWTQRDEGMGECWDDDALAVAKGIIDTKREIWREQLQEAQETLAAFGDGPTPPTRGAGERAQATPSTTTPGKTLYQAITAYSEHLKGKRKSDKHKHRAIQVVEVNLKRVRQDCPLSSIDFVWIDSVCDHFKGRPKNLKDGTPLKPAGVKNILTYLRLFFTWLDDTEYGGWQAPRKMLKCFRVRIGDLMTPAELRDASAIRQFDLDTLKKLHAAASDRTRLWMLTALFTGATQQELAVMEKVEFNLENATLTHLRNKTRVTGVYWLPPELLALLRAEFEARPKDELAFRTADGNCLVTFKDGRQTSDAVRQAWDDLRDAAKLEDALPFKYLRKYLGDWMIRHGGEEMGQVALSHSRQTVLARNYTTSRAFDRFNRLQKRMYAELSAAGLFAIPASKSRKAAAKAA